MLGCCIKNPVPISDLLNRKSWVVHATCWCRRDKDRPVIIHYPRLSVRLPPIATALSATKQSWQVWEDNKKMVYGILLAILRPLNTGYVATFLIFIYYILLLFTLFLFFKEHRFLPEQVSCPFYQKKMLCNSELWRWGTGACLECGRWIGKWVR